MNSSQNKTLFIAVVVLAIAILAYIFIPKLISSSTLDKTTVITSTDSIATGLQNLVNNNVELVGYFGYILTYGFRFIFGIDFTNIVGNAVSDSSVIIQIAVWSVFFLVFRDLIKVFGMIEDSTSGLIGFFMAVITANLGFFSGVLNLLMEIFAALAGLAVMAVLASIFFFAVVSHWGINEFGVRMMNRKAMIEAQKTVRGGEELAGTIKGLKRVGDALKKKTGR